MEWMAYHGFDLEKRRSIQPVNPCLRWSHKPGHHQHITHARARSTSTQYHRFKIKQEKRHRLWIQTRNKTQQYHLTLITPQWHVTEKPPREYQQRGVGVGFTKTWNLREWNWVCYVGRTTEEREVVNGRVKCEKWVQGKA